MTTLVAKTREVLRVLGEAARMAPALGFRIAKDHEKVSLGTIFEETVARCPNNIMLLFEQRQWTYNEFNSEVNQLARVLESLGVSRGDSVALFMENRAEYVLSVLALLKLGAAASLINNSLTGHALVHCIKATGATKCIVGEERAYAIDEVRGELGITAGSGYLWFADTGSHSVPDWACDARAEMAIREAHNLQVTGDITAGETALYIFTSGTTGLPKAAIVQHRKILAAAKGMGRLGFRIKPRDRLYLCLPIYHITGMGPGLCGFIAAGGSIFLRRSFSASAFWPEVQQYQVNCFIYVGELCRYLLMQPECAEEENNPLQKMLGNGLRPDVWVKFKSRFDIARICEIYGASEGNVTFVNLLNKNQTIGAAVTKIAVVEYDIERDEIVRDSAGHCIEVPLGQAGLLLGEINATATFEGYTDPDASARKIVHNAIKDGDRWFNTGDLVRQIDVGFALGLKHFQFVDRTGDTFRWRAENVSTNEVAEVLNTHPQIHMANVFGVEVPGVEGRAGMVSFSLHGEDVFDFAEFAQLVESELPSYAQPVFVRLQRDMATTGTFKLLKAELREQAYHLDRVDGDEIYFRKPRSQFYERLDEKFYQSILDGSAGY